MRQLMVYVPAGQGARVLDQMKDRKGLITLKIDAHTTDQKWDLLLLHVENSALDKILGELQEIDELRVEFSPSGVIALKPPADKAAEQVTDVTPRSPLEVFLSGLQSVGSWSGFLGYAFAAGAVVWVALFTNTTFLLVAAMLIAPFASPAMTLAMGTARGDRSLILQSILRYFAALSVTIFSAWLLSFLFQQEVATALVVDRSMISTVTVLLPLVAGAAGALNLCQSDRDSLVTAAGTGMLVAASLAPPAGVVGIATALGEWDMVKSGFFVLLLQLVGINFSGTIVFWLYGLKPQGVRYARGQNWIKWTSMAASALALVGLLYWQFHDTPNLQRATVSQRVESDIQKSLNQSELVEPVEVTARFTRADIKGQNTLLIRVYAQKKDDVTLSQEEIQSSLRQKILELVRTRHENLTPLANVTVLTP